MTPRQYAVLVFVADPAENIGKATIFGPFDSFAAATEFAKTWPSSYVLDLPPATGGNDGR